MSKKEESIREKFQKETGESFDGIEINGLHLQYIEWLEAKVEGLKGDKRAKVITHLNQKCSEYKVRLKKMRGALHSKKGAVNSLRYELEEKDATIKGLTAEVERLKLQQLGRLDPKIVQEEMAKKDKTIKELRERIKEVENITDDCYNYKDMYEMRNAIEAVINPQP